MSTTFTGLSITDVRTFAGRHHASLSRITVLIGENSVGKSSFLGCLNAIGRLSSLHDLDDGANYFNQKPFNMGSFNSIARSGCKSFSVSVELSGGPFSKFAIEFTEGSGAGLTESKLKICLADQAFQPSSELAIARENPADQLECWNFEGPGFPLSLDRSEVSYRQFTTWLSRTVAYGILPFLGDPDIFRRRAGLSDAQDVAAFAKFVNFFRHRFRFPETLPRIIPIPVQGLKRQRWYSADPIRGLGHQVDFEMINETGRRLGLFNRIHVREHSSQRFEILADISGSLHNLADVGYGVGCLLPFVTALSTAPPKSLFLQQHPEVHLHPSAQAILVKVMATSDHAFVVETHSDHLIAWLRILVKEGLLAPSDVSIIYFEQSPQDKSVTHLYEITLDARANLEGQPRSYRQFFGEETARLLGFST